MDFPLLSKLVRSSILKICATLTRIWEIAEPTTRVNGQDERALPAAAPIHRKDTITMAIILYVNLDSNGRFLYNDVVQSLFTHN